ncbi:MAG: RluA family pseudouridine synthase [bacterium]|nr:RluA family pseudouridine synthase [bacterium]
MKTPEILFENDDVVVINKPVGLIVHSDGRTVEPSVAEWILEKFPETHDVGEPWKSPQGEIVPRPGIVHRLDRTTSGVMIIAKTSVAHALLKKQFQERSVEKEYRAFVYGHPKEDKGVIEAEIRRTRSTPPRWSAEPGGSNRRAAITEWEVLRRGTDPESGEPISLLIVRPKTGRTHQIRVHLKSIHHAVVCDSLYAPKQPCLLGFSRPALHASRLSITLPSGENKTFEAPLPEDFLDAERQLEG